MAVSTASLVNNQELLEHGWVLTKERNVTNWGQTLPEAKIVYYNKGVYSLSLEYTGNYRDFTFSIGLGWGLGN